VITYGKPYEMTRPKNQSSESELQADRNTNDRVALQKLCPFFAAVRFETLIDPNSAMAVTTKNS
jgi:hypothetical protein